MNEVVGKVEGVARTRTVMAPWKLKDVYHWDIPGDPADRRNTPGQRRMDVG